MSDPTALYRYFDVDDRLLYVGIANDPFRRMAQHRHRGTWWTEVARMELEQFETRELALAAERSAIQNERPIYNIVHNTQVPAAPRPLAIHSYCAACNTRIYDGDGELFIDLTAVMGQQRDFPPRQPERDDLGNWTPRDITAVAQFRQRYPEPERWFALHYHHNVDIKDGGQTLWGYSIEVHRIASLPHVFFWNEHLTRKRWVRDFTNWTQMLTDLPSGTGPLRTSQQLDPSRPEHAATRYPIREFDE